MHLWRKLVDRTRVRGPMDGTIPPWNHETVVRGLVRGTGRVPVPSCWCCHLVVPAKSLALTKEKVPVHFSLLGLRRVVP